MNASEHVLAIAAEVCQRRTDWKPNGVQAALWQAKNRAADPAELRAAAMRAAEDPNARTPAAIAFDAYWTKAAQPADDRPRFSGALPECVHCGAPVARDATPKFCRDCGRPWQPRIWDRRVVEIDRARITCDHCGHGQYRYSDFCSECGTRLTPPPPPADPKLAERLARIAADHIDEALPEPDDTEDVDW